MENTELWNRARKLNLGKDFLNGLDELLTSLESDNKQLIITDVVQQSELLLCNHCDNKKALHSDATGLCPDRFKHFEAK